MGQVWTAKVSGKETKVQIMAELPPPSPGARAQFEYKNLTTGRMATGTAGKLRSKLEDGGPAGGTPAGTVPASPPPILRSRAEPVRRAMAPPGRTSPTQAELDLGFPVYSPPAPAYNPPGPGQGWSDPRRPLRGQPGAPAPLQSLRGSPRPLSTRRRTGARNNPPSRAARSAAQAIQESGAQTPAQVLQVVQAWAAQERQQEHGAYGWAGAPAGYGPYDNPHGQYGNPAPSRPTAPWER